MKIQVLGAMAAILCAAPTVASAGIYSEDATRCVVKSATDPDKEMMVQWIFANASVHPALKTFVTITPAQRNGYNKKMAALVVRLLSKDCHKEVVEALKYEGSAFLQSSFSALGEVAMGGMMTDPNVNQAMADYTKDLDMDTLTALATEAGRPVPAK